MRRLTTVYNPQTDISKGRSTVKVFAKKSSASDDIAIKSAFKSEAGIESALLKLSARGARQKPKPPVQEPDDKALQKQVKLRVEDHPTSAKNFGSAAAVGKAKKMKQERLSSTTDASKDESLDMDKIWREVKATIKAKNKDRDFDEDDGGEDSNEVSAMNSGSLTATQHSKSRGFGAPSSSPSSSHSTPKKQPSVSQQGFSMRQSSEPLKFHPIRIYLYAVDLGSVQQAILDAGLSGKVEIGLDIKQCDAVVTAKLSKRGTSINLGQGERTAVNAGIPFFCVGRSMNGQNLNSALQPLLNPEAATSSSSSGNTSTVSLTREAARAAVRAFKASGGGSFFLPPPARSPMLPVSVAVTQGASSADSHLSMHDDEGRTDARVHTLRPSPSAPTHIDIGRYDSEEDEDLDLLREQVALHDEGLGEDEDLDLLIEQAALHDEGLGEDEEEQDAVRTNIQTSNSSESGESHKGLTSVRRRWVTRTTNSDGSTSNAPVRRSSAGSTKKLRLAPSPR
ncbi:hypothetical protein CEUSTIGMA_g9502.t1 [Chlamydomonas eustigma]|uniref:Uncharacterized protein n=1 Tax=Chlamydomonas eustigma TaxID=1157962 RepID=A0A250XG69_9CHLO|nr:hypothetical protein CEUSTIGMA_g9502.t1 [Chlamydomonas eustigma]|eukprot:GAX82074.1 hypothetical protein CEUSTIGMA_g9502.t1 [Chlamydomonas eustigma]